jgi:hypothetical protein
MKTNSDEIYNIVNTAIDAAVTSEKYQLNFYSFLKGENIKRQEIKSFIDSSLVSQIRDEISHLNLYLDGGPDVADLREVYGWMGKPRARKYKEYLMKIIEDAEKYEVEKRPGRKPGTKNRKKQSAVTNK